MSHFSGKWEEAEKIYYLLTDCECPIYFLDNKHVYDTAKWLASKGVRITVQQEPPKGGEMMKITLELPDGTKAGFVNLLVDIDEWNKALVSKGISTEDIKAGYKDCREYEVAHENA